MKCLSCGNELATDNKGSICSNCTIVYNIVKFNEHHDIDKLRTDSINVSIGWECPRCHKIHAPFIVECDCLPVVQTITTTGTVMDNSDDRHSKYTQLTLDFDNNSR